MELFKSRTRKNISETVGNLENDDPPPPPPPPPLLPLPPLTPRQIDLKRLKAIIQFKGKVVKIPERDRERNEFDNCCWYRTTRHSILIAAHSVVQYLNSDEKVGKQKNVQTLLWEHNNLWLTGWLRNENMYNDQKSKRRSKSAPPLTFIVPHTTVFVVHLFKLKSRITEATTAAVHKQHPKPQTVCISLIASDGFFTMCRRIYNWQLCFFTFILSILWIPAQLITDKNPSSWF